MKSRTDFEEVVHAIRRGGVDALVVEGKKGDEVVVLQGSEHPYRVLVESFNDGAATLDAKGTILYLNDRFAEIIGKPRQKLLGAPLLDHIPWRGRDELKRMIRTQTRSEVILKSGGEWERVVRFALGPVKSSEGRNICLIASEQTDLVKITEALKASEQSLRELSSRILKLQDDERRHIARDLHDITGQSLAVQAMMLANLMKRESELDEKTHKVLNECAEINKRVSDEVRTLSYLLHPPLLDELGLGSAIEWYAAGFQSRSGIAITVEIDPNFPRLSPDMEIALFRILQESLTNVHRYSGSVRAYVRLRRTPKEISLEVGDFGKGMRKPLVAGGAGAAFGVGILGMKERVRQLEGRLEINSRENQGTTVTAILPFAKANGASPKRAERARANSSARQSPRKAKTAATSR